MPVFRYAEDEADLRRCYPVMVQLRPHLGSADEFIARWRRQVAGGYRLLAIFDGMHVVSVAGFRVQENLAYGRFLYVDDLVTDSTRRGGGHGERLLARLKQEAHALGCVQLVLDTPLANSPGQRFYLRNGLLSTAMRFRTAIAP